MTALSRWMSRASYPLFDLWDRSDRLQEWARLEKAQWQPPSQVADQQLARLNSMLIHAYETVPYYRHAWDQAPKLNHLCELSRFPVLTKADVRAAGKDLLSTTIPIERLITAKTGGSTGTSLVLYFDHACQQHRNAAALLSDSWAGWRTGDWVGGLWGSPERPKSLKQKVRNWLRERMEYLDTMRLDPASMEAFLAVMRDRPLHSLFGHAHSLYILADYVVRTQAKIPAPRAIISTSMMLLATERKTIEQAFGCKVSDRYGCEEVGLIAAQCNHHQGLHINAEHLIVEILDDTGEPCLPGAIGRVVVTDLENKAMPLIRYEVGDLSAWSASACTCGRSWPTLERVIGRQADCLVRADGSLIAGVSLVERTLTAISGIEQLQLEQLSPTLLLAHAVVSQGDESRIERELTEALSLDLGTGIQIRTEFTERIPQEKNGKYRFAIRRF